MINIVSKETEFPPKYLSKKNPPEKQIRKAIDDAMRKFSEIDLPELRKKFPPADGDTLKLVINK